MSSQSINNSRCIPPTSAETAGEVSIAAITLSAETTPPNRLSSFRVKKLTGNEENLAALRKTADVWKQIANENVLQSRDPKEREIFFDARCICGMIGNGDMSCRRIFVCYDAKDDPQAIAITGDFVDQSSAAPYLYLFLLVTNPKNIRSHLNENPVKGAGTAMISHLARLCLQENKTKIELYAYSSAVPFYKKLGFESLRPGSSYLQLNLRLRPTVPTVPLSEMSFFPRLRGQILPTLSKYCQNLAINLRRGREKKHRFI